MDLKEFELTKNRQRPEMCYGYTKKAGDLKFQIFTMDGGRSFLATIEKRRMDNRYYIEFEVVCHSIDECLTAFDGFSG